MLVVVYQVLVQLLLQMLQILQHQLSKGVVSALSSVRVMVMEGHIQLNLLITILMIQKLLFIELLNYLLLLMLVHLMHIQYH